MNLPNIITISRLLLTPYIVWLILSESYFLGFIFFLLSGFSDALDGFIAKKFNQQTLLGSYLDPIADKFLIVSSIVMLGTNLRIEPLIISKINTFLQIFYIVITFLVILNNQLLIELTTSIHGITTYLIAISTILSWMSYLKVWLINVNSVNKNY